VPVDRRDPELVVQERRDDRRPLAEPRVEGGAPQVDELRQLQLELAGEPCLEAGLPLVALALLRARSGRSLSSTQSRSGPLTSTIPFRRSTLTL